MKSSCSGILCVGVASGSLHPSLPETSSRTLASAHAAAQGRVGAPQAVAASVCDSNIAWKYTEKPGKHSCTSKSGFQTVLQLLQAEQKCSTSFTEQLSVPPSFFRDVVWKSLSESGRVTLHLSNHGPPNNRYQAAHLLAKLIGLMLQQ